MKKLDYLKYCFQNEGYFNKGVLQGILAIQLEDEDSSGQFKKLPHAVFVEGGKFNVIIDGKTEEVEGDAEGPLFQMDDILELPGDFHPLLKGKGVRTTFGLFLHNVILIWEPFKGVVDYINKEFTKPLFENLFREIMVSNPRPGESIPEGKASVKQCLEFTHNCYFLEGLGTHFIKPGGLDALTVHPEVLALKAKLFKEHAHELNDPVVFTNILDQMVDLDYKITMAGPSRKFFIAKKFIDNSRKRMFIAFGIEPNPTGDGWVAITDSLDQGWDPKYLVTYINTSVAGSYSRSMATGEGGAEVKNTLRLIGRALVSSETVDCKTPVLEDIIIEKDSAFYWVGSWVATKAGLLQLDEKNVFTFLGKTIQVRVPQFCILNPGELCKTCCGQGLGAYGERLSAEMALIPTTMMLQRMKAAHTAGASTSILDLEVALK